MEMAAASVTTSNNEVQAEAVDPEGSRPASPKAPVRKHRAKIECAELTKNSDVPPPKSDNLQTVIIISRVITDNSRVTAEMTTIKPENTPAKIENSQLEIQAAVIEESKTIIIAEDLSLITQKQAEPDDDRGKEDTNEIIPVIAEEVDNISCTIPADNDSIEAIIVKVDENENTPITLPEKEDSKEVVQLIVEEILSTKLSTNDEPKEVILVKVEETSTKLSGNDDLKEIVQIKLKEKESIIIESPAIEDKKELIPLKLEEIENITLESPTIDNNKELIPLKLEEKESESTKLPPKAKTVHPEEVKITPPKVKDSKSQVKVINAAVKVFNKLMPGKRSSTVKQQTSTENIAELKVNGTKEVKLNEESKIQQTKMENTQTKIPQIKPKILHQAKNDESKVENKDNVSIKKVIQAPKVLNSLATVVDEVKKQQPKDDSQPSRIAFINQRKKLAENVKSQQLKDENDQAKIAAAVNKAINHPKIESDATVLKRLRSSTEQLNQENTSLKKVLESERSAFREHRALHEAEMRKERAEGKRREGALEGQLRSALKGLPQPPHGEGSAQADAAKLVSALQAVKSANKNLQDKLQVVTEADKRKVSEIRAQHDAHATRLQQMEREARAQTAKLLEELKTKERQLEQVKRGARGVPPGGGLPKLPAKMAVAEQLLAMEDQISRLENELQRRDDIIRSLRNSRAKRQPISRRSSRENLLKDTISDVDSAVSSAPTSLSPQPSPDLWFHSQEASRKEVDESLLEVQRRQIQELEKALTLSSVGQRTAQLRATQLEEQLQDLREQADLLEFRCLELEDTSEKRNSLEELTDSDSGCTSPEDRLKNSVSPQLRRSDSGYKSPTHQPASPNLKNRRILSTPITGLSESESAPHVGKMHLQVNDHTLENGQQSDDIRDRLERMLVKTHNETDRNCLEQVLQLLWNLQALSSNLSDEDFSMIKNKKTIDNDSVKNDFEQTKTSKIIATISPYSQTSPHKIIDVTKSVSNNEPDLLNTLIKEESKKLLYGLQESGIFDETDWDNKSTQTDWCDCAYAEPQSDLATEVQRLNQIREQLEKSGAIRNKNFKLKQLENDIFIECNQTDPKQQSKHERKLIDFYEKRNALLESKISIYESSEEVKQKKLAQRLQIEIDLQSKVEILEIDLDELQRKYIILEEERCEIEEEENDTRLHCQELEAEFELLSAKLRDMDEQRICAKNESDCYRELVQEYEDKSMCMLEQEKDLKERLQIMEKTVPALIFWNIYKLIAQYPEFDFRAAYNARFSKTSIKDCSGKSGRSASSDSRSSRMIVHCKDNSSDPLVCIEKQLRLLDSEKKEIQKRCKEQEDMLRKRMAKLERVIFESKETCMRQEEEANNRIKALEKELSAVKEKSSGNRDKSDTQVCTSDAECTKKIQAFIAREKELKCHIEELQKKELAYINTLNQGDEMWAEMEQQYKQKIKEYEENEASLTEKIHKCESDRNRWKGICEPLEQKVRELEESEAALETGIRRLQDESQNLLALNEDLSKQAQNLKMELTQSKAESKFALEALKSELSVHKKMSEDIQVELKIQKSIQIDLESNHSSRVIQMRREISKSSKDLLDLDVTNGELKEEVDTLENQVTELSNELTKQREENEEKIKSLLEELSNKSKEYDELEREITGYQYLPSAHEELQQFNKFSPFEAGFNNKLMCSCNVISKQREDSVSCEDLTCCRAGKIVSTDTSDKAVMTDPPAESTDGGLLNKNSASTPNVTLSSTAKSPSQSTPSSDGQSGQHRQKPELPKRKPKVTPKPHLPLKNDENKKSLLQRSFNYATKPSKESITKISRELTGSLLTIIESKDKKKLSTEDFVKEKKDLENRIFKMINDSLDVNSDESAHRSCREEEINVSEENARNMNARVAPEEVTACKSPDRGTSPHVQESLKIFEKTCDNPNFQKPVRLDTPPLPSIGRDDFQYTDTQNWSPDSPVTLFDNDCSSFDLSKTTSTNSVVNTESKSTEKNGNICQSSSAKDLITNFNSINTNSKPNGSATEPLKYVVQSPAKPIGGLVFDRVAKLTNGIINSNSPIALKRSVSMTSDSKSLPAKSLYIYADY